MSLLEIKADLIEALDGLLGSTHVHLSPAQVVIRPAGKLAGEGYVTDTKASGSGALRLEGGVSLSCRGISSIAGFSSGTWPAVHIC